MFANKARFSAFKVFYVGLALLFLMAIITTITLTASLNSTTSTLAHTQEQGTEHPHQTGQMVAAQKALPHFENGVFTGNYHLIDEELYWLLMLIIINNGGDPSPRNVDGLYHQIGD